MQNFELIQCTGPDELAARAAKEWLDEIERANRVTAAHDVALSADSCLPGSTAPAQRAD